MNWELIKEVLRRTEATQAKVGEVDPIAWVEFYRDDSWTIKCQNAFGDDHTVEMGTGAHELLTYLDQLRK